MHIDPKAPANSPQHPRNWRVPDFREPGIILRPGFEPQAVDTLPPGGTPVAKKVAPKKTSKAKKPSVADLAAALAELDAE